MRRRLVLGGAALCVALAGCQHKAAVSAPQNEITTEYDLIYALNRGVMNGRPSPFLVATVSGFKQHAGLAVDLGGGAGRNSLWLAQQGYQVTDVDLSRVGLDLAKQQAEGEHLQLTTVAADINQYDLGAAKWDLIALIDFPFAYKPLLPKIAAGLKPGGVVVIQAVSVGQPGLESPDHVLQYTFMDRRDLNAPFAGFTVLHDSVSEEATVWGVKTLMVRFSARKP